MIESYRFGEMVVGSVCYKSDLIILPDRIIDNWWRASGHLLAIDDLSQVIEFGPDSLVVGTGNNGMMKVPGKLEKALASYGIRLYANKTNDAWPIFNRLVDEGRKVAGAFHLTC